jgi:hypothetical protein
MLKKSNHFCIFDRILKMFPEMQVDQVQALQETIVYLTQNC